jgi:hypothetical protein
VGRAADTWLAPGSTIRQLMAAIGLGVTSTEVAGYTLGVPIVLAAVFLLGLLVDSKRTGWPRCWPCWGWTSIRPARQRALGSGACGWRRRTPA